MNQPGEKSVNQSHEKLPSAKQSKVLFTIDFLEIDLRFVSGGGGLYFSMVRGCAILGYLFHDRARS